MNVTLLPAGHIFGSAQLFAESDAGSLLYTGDFKLRPGLSAERTEWRHAQTLIMETTYGLPRYCMPPTEEVMAQMVTFVARPWKTERCRSCSVTRSENRRKSSARCCKAGLTPMLHGAVYPHDGDLSATAAGVPYRV